MANEIKQALAQGHTLEVIRDSGIALTGEVELFRRAGQVVLGRLDEAVKRSPSAGRAALTKKLQAQKKLFDRHLKALHSLVGSLRRGKM